MFSNIIVLKLGGSLVVPKDIDTKYLKSFATLIKKHIQKGKRFVVIVGGGYTNRWYRDKAKGLGVSDDTDLHWIGIMSTRLNAEFVKSLFGRAAHEDVYWNFSKKLNWKKKILVVAGYKPGCSTDQDAVLIAKQFGSKKIIKLTNIDYIYTKDPKKFKNTKAIADISWKDYFNLFNNSKKHDPGQHVPVDVVAAMNASKHDMEVCCLGGKNLKNFDAFLSGKMWKGTSIHN